MNPLCLGPIPAHLTGYAWYAPHQAWLRDRGLPHHDPGDAEPERANLAGANLTDANLAGADLQDANLWCAILADAILTGAYLRGANLAGADLTGVDLRNANLAGAILAAADLRGAYLQDASLRDASLTGADLTDANLQDATMPDGRALEEWQADPLAGLCTEPEATSRAIAAWGEHSWQSCPMHAAHGWTGIDDAPEDKRVLVATFVALFDGGHLPKPRSTT